VKLISGGLRSVIRLALLPMIGQPGTRGRPAVTKILLIARLIDQGLYPLTANHSFRSRHKIL
jgi:hypothetical protein